MNETFKLTLGPRQGATHPIRHANDYTRELLVDFSSMPPGSLGFITAIHCTISGDIYGWSIFDCEGGDLPGVERWHWTKESAVQAARETVAQLTGALPD